MKNMHLSFYSLLLIFVIISSSCKDISSDPQDNKEIKFAFNFQNGTDSWLGGFSDYPVGLENIYKLQFGHSRLPENLDQTKYSLIISGNNYSDDLFMFIKRKIVNLKPNANYILTFNLQIASQYPQTAIGIGGSPGGSVALKVGAATQEPISIISNGFNRMNIDKGNQADSGVDMKTIGTIGIPGNNFIYTLINRSNSSNPFLCRSNNSGEIWVIIGTDSGYEGNTTIYFSNVELLFVEN